MRNDLANMCGKCLKKKPFDRATKPATYPSKTRAQIRLLHRTTTSRWPREDSVTLLANTIPLLVKTRWCCRCVWSTAVRRWRHSAAVTNMTNELLRKNADTLKMGSLEAAKEAERGIVHIEALTYTDQSLISTLDDVLRIQQEGAQKREAAETASCARSRAN